MKKLDVARRFFVMLALTVSGALAVVLLAPFFMPPDEGRLVTYSEPVPPSAGMLERFERASQNIQSESGTGLPEGTVAQAEPAPTPGYNYVVLPGPDYGGLPANWAQAWPRINFTIRNPVPPNPIDPNPAGQSVAYVPNEFLVVSDRPSFSFEMRGGRWDYSGSPTGSDAYDRRNPGPGGANSNDDPSPQDTVLFVNGQKGESPGVTTHSPVYYEVYQLSNGRGQNGAECFFGEGVGSQVTCPSPEDLGGELLGVINARDTSVFPSIDDNPSSQTCSGGPCWRSFSGGTNGGDIKPGGGAQANLGQSYELGLPGIADGRFRGVDSNMRFNSSAYPNLNGYYVFLIKTVAYRDLWRGYVRNTMRFSTESEGPQAYYGCGLADSLNGQNNGSISCPNELRNWFTTNKPGRLASRPLLENGYFIRALNTPPAVSGTSTGRQFIASAPANMALSLDWGLFSPPGSEFTDSLFYTARMSAGGAGSRNDGYPGQFMSNADWDSRPACNRPKPGNDIDEAPCGLGSQRQIAGFITRYGSGQGWRQVINFGGGGLSTFGFGGISSNWDLDADRPMFVNLDFPGVGGPFSAPPSWTQLEQPQYMGMNASGNLDIKYWNHSNDILLGGQPFTTGQWPTSEPQSTVTGYTPRAYEEFPSIGQSGYVYNGRDSFTPIGNSVRSDLTFGFAYQTSNSRPQVRYDVRVSDGSGLALYSFTESPYWFITNPNVAYRSATDEFVTQSSNSLQERPRASIPSEVANLTVDLNNLNPNQTYYWQACAYPAQLNFTNCSPPKGFRVNKGPTTTITSTPPNISQGGTTVAYRCSQLQFRLDDPEGHQVFASATATWDDQNGTNAVRFNQINGAAKASGSTFTGDELEVASWTVNGNNRTFDDGTTLSEVVNDLAVGTNLTLNLRGADNFGASDNDLFTWALSSQKANYEFPSLTGTPGPPQYQTQVSNPGFDYGVNGQHKFGPVNTGTYIVQSGVEFETESKKEFLDTNGNVISTVADGQTVQVRTTIVNGGDSPANRYAIKDYLGSIRDFERPTNVTVTTQAGGTRNVPASQVAAVVSDRDNADNDEVLTEPFDTQSTDYRNGEWRIDIGQNGGAYLPAGSLAPGQAVVIQYTTTANRNQNVVPGDTQQGDFSRKLSPSDTHFWVFYQEAFCDANSLVGKSIDVMGVSVQAPFLRTLRGSVGSNRSLFGYSGNLSGEENATFLVQSGGNLSHFNAADDSNEIAGYDGQQTGCTDPDILEGGVDWRTEMIKNIQKLNSGSKNTNLNPLLNPGSGQPRGQLDRHGSNVWVVGSPTARQNLTIDNPISFEGVGTILVYGDLTINANLTYDADSSKINSVGFIVVGNITINPSVTELVGTYYALDSDPPAIGADGCAANVQPNRGIISTGASSLALDVQGVMVARGFNFERFFVNPGDPDEAPDPAEDVYYDGRVLANTPPGFGVFRNTSAWYEIAP